MEFSNEKWNNEKWTKRNNGRNQAAKSRKNLYTWREGKLQVLGNTESGHHQTDLKLKRKKKSGPEEGKNFAKPSSVAEILLKGQILGQFPQKDTWNFLKMNKRGTQTNGQENT